ncbi:MAG: hypothetical protein KGI54_11530 [Pseudomonadota bacterium]|nr:hypothetical protein [Pseudomonadota bacterium]
MSVVIDGTLGIDTIQANTVTSAKIVDATIAPADLSGAQSGSAPIYGARAWCVFDGTLTGTNAPTAGGNITSITRNSTGEYTINFTTAMQDANYAINVMCQSTSGNSLISAVIGQASAPYNGTLPTASSFRIAVVIPTIGYVDSPKIYVAVFR